MDNFNDQIRMTLRLPKDLREALEVAVQQGSSASVTAEIIHRLRKSFDLQPLNSSDPNGLIKQCAAMILDTVEKNEKKTSKGQITKAANLKEPMTEDEKKLSDEFNMLPKHKRKMAVNLFLAISSLIKAE
jgi:hypothetical protein